MSIVKWNEEKDGCLNHANLESKIRRCGYSTTTYTYPPGTFFPDHTHGVDKLDAVLEGEFQIIADGKKMLLKPGDCLKVPKGCVHSARVIGNTPVISIDGIKSP